MAKETPTIMAATAVSQSYDLNSLKHGMLAHSSNAPYGAVYHGDQMTAVGLGQIPGWQQHGGWQQAADADMARMRRVSRTPPQQPQPVEPEEEEMAESKRRLVQVFIADPDPNVPLEDAMIYSGDQHMTDMDDNELFFQIDIRERLKTHNDKRIKIVDKTVKERTQYLEPARIRDLKMVVVTVAEF